jgi:hypothetical protein
VLIRVDDEGARYPLTIDPFIGDLTETAKLTALEANVGDTLGTSVASKR